MPFLVFCLGTKLNVCNCYEPAQSNSTGESKTIELKLQLPQHNQIVKTVVAFANTSGGKLVVGVNDDREIVA